MSEKLEVSLHSRTIIAWIGGNGKIWKLAAKASLDRLGINPDAESEILNYRKIASIINYGK